MTTKKPRKPPRAQKFKVGKHGSITVRVEKGEVWLYFRWLMTSGPKGMVFTLDKPHALAKAVKQAAAYLESRGVRK